MKVTNPTPDGHSDKNNGSSPNNGPTILEKQQQGILRIQSAVRMPRLSSSCTMAQKEANLDFKKSRFEAQVCCLLLCDLGQVTQPLKLITSFIKRENTLIASGISQSQ